MLVWNILEVQRHRYGSREGRKGSSDSFRTINSALRSREATVTHRRKRGDSGIALEIGAIARERKRGKRFAFLLGNGEPILCPACSDRGQMCKESRRGARLLTDRSSRPKIEFQFPQVLLRPTRFSRNRSSQRLLRPSSVVRNSRESDRINSIDFIRRFSSFQAIDSYVPSLDSRDSRAKLCEGTKAGEGLEEKWRNL